MTQKFLSDPEDWGSVDMYKDEWFVVYYYYGAAPNNSEDGFRAVGPYPSRMKAEAIADDMDVSARVVHSVFTS